MVTLKTVMVSVILALAFWAIYSDADCTLGSPNAPGCGSDCPNGCCCHLTGTGGYNNGTADICLVPVGGCHLTTLLGVLVADPVCTTACAGIHTAFSSFTGGVCTTNSTT